MIGTNMQEALAPVALPAREPRRIRTMLVAATIIVAAGVGVGTWQAWPHGSAATRTNVSGIVQANPALSAFEHLKQEGYSDTQATQRLDGLKRLKQEAYTDPGTTQRLDAFKRLKNGA